MGKTKWTPAKKKRRPKARKAPVEGEDNDAEYELKVLRTRVVKGVEESLVHWIGWGSQYDEWIPSANINRVTESEEGEEQEDKKGKAKKRREKRKEREPVEKEEQEAEEEGEEEEEKQAKKRGTKPRGRRGRKSSTLKEDEEEEEEMEKEKEKEEEEEDEGEEDEDENDENYGESVDEEGSSRKRMWTDQELSLLEQATEEASRPDSVSWVQVASQVGNRTPRSCKRRWQRLQACHRIYKSPRQLEKRKEMIKESRTRPWTEQEEARLLKEVIKKGLHYESDMWVALESKFKRSAGALQLRWSELHDKRGGAVSLSDAEGREDFDEEKRGRKRAVMRRSLKSQSSSEASASEGESNHERPATVPMEVSSDDQREKEKETTADNYTPGTQRARYQRKRRQSSGARKSFVLSRAPYPLGSSQETAGDVAGAAEPKESPRHSKPRSPVASQKDRSDDDDDDEDEGVEEERKRRTKKRRKKARKERERLIEETDSPHISLDEMDWPINTNPTGGGERTALVEDGDGEVSELVTVSSVAQPSPENGAEAEASQEAGESEDGSEDEAVRKKHRRKRTTSSTMQLDDSPRSPTTKGRKSKATRSEEGEMDSPETKERRKEREKKQAEDLHAWVERQRELNLERFGQRTLTPRLSGRTHVPAIRRRTIGGNQLVDRDDEEPTLANKGNAVQRRERRHSVAIREDAGEEVEVDDFLMGRKPGKRLRESSPSSGESSGEQNRQRKRARTTAPAAAEEDVPDTHQDYRDSEEEDMERAALELEKEKRTIARFEMLARERRQALSARRRRKDEEEHHEEEEEDENHEDEEREIIERIESVVTKRKKAVRDRVITGPARTDDSEWQVVFGVDDAGYDGEREVAAPDPAEELIGDEVQNKQAERDVIADIEQAVRRKRRQSLKAEQLRDRREREAAAEIERQREAQEEIREETTKIEKLLTKKRRQSMTALREKHNREAIASAMRSRRWTLGGLTRKLEGDEGDIGSAESEEEEEEEVDRVVDELKSLVERQRREQDAARRKRLEDEQRREAEKRARQIEDRESVKQLCRYWSALHQRG